MFDGGCLALRCPAPCCAALTVLSTHGAVMGHRRARSGRDEVAPSSEPLYNAKAIHGLKQEDVEDGKGRTVASPRQGRAGATPDSAGGWSARLPSAPTSTSPPAHTGMGGDYPKMGEIHSASMFLIPGNIYSHWRIHMAIHLYMMRNFNATSRLVWPLETKVRQNLISALLSH